jgi:hypothetical protein
MDWSAWKKYIGPRPEPRTVTLTDYDDETEAPIVAESIECEGQSFMIEYVNSKEEHSCRNITVWTVAYNKDGRPFLRAVCHTRKAMRSFVVERIQSCIDYDGAVHAPASFLLENLGLDTSLRGKVASGNKERLLAAQRIARPHAVLLAGLSRCDGYMHESELSILRTHCENLFDHLTLEETNRLGRRYHLLKPTSDQLDLAIEEFRSEKPDTITRFLVSAHELIKADGVLMEEEVILFNEFCDELTGVKLLHPG